MSDFERLGGILPRALADIGVEQAPQEPWECPHCGIIQPIRLPTGRYIRRSCECERAARRQLLLREQRKAWMAQQVTDTFHWLPGAHNSDMPLSEKTFETFKPIWWATDPKTKEKYEVNLQEAYDTARDFTLDPTGVLVFFGPYGVGKSHLLAAICNELRLREVASRFVMAPKLHRAIADCYQHNEDAGPIMRKAIMTPLLVIDDVGASKWTESRQETYEMIIEERTKHGRPIALSTNHLDKLTDFVGGRACSRLSIGQIAVEMTGADYRMEM